MGRRRRRRSSPPPDNTAQLVAEANKRAAEDAAKAREDNRRQLEAMQAKADAERKKAEAIARTPSPTKIGSTMGSAEQGLTRKKQYEKRKRARKASDLRIALTPAASLVPERAGGTQGQPTIS